MASNTMPPTPHDIPGAWIGTPGDPARAPSYLRSQPTDGSAIHTQPSVGHEHSSYDADTGFIHGSDSMPQRVESVSTDPARQSSSGTNTAVPTPQNSRSEDSQTVGHASSASLDEKGEGTEAGYVPIKSGGATAKRPQLQSSHSKILTEEDLFKVLSKRRPSSFGRRHTATTVDSNDEEQEEINQLMSRMFGRTRQDASEEEQTRHLGVVFKNLTVKGMGVGAALQPSVGDIFLGLPRFLKNLVARGPRKAAGKPPVRTILDDFSGCIKPGEMLLVLGRPGAGCSTFLKVIGNQRFGYEDISGEVTYGGTDAKTMGKRYRSEVLYNPEDDLHYATLTVKQTLRFALKTRTPGKSSRKEGESRGDYVNEFLRVVSKLFWIEHTMGTKVGNEFVRGVSGGNCSNHFFGDNC